MIGEPGPELLRSSHAVFGDCGIDLKAADNGRVARQPEPHILYPQHRCALFVVDLVTQRPMPGGDVLMKIM
jgi:hypothetical protein